ncbi:MAG TPA: pilus assembly protein, partial [Bradyrhizobium sp.]|nr:pilus assembly protein [Bradyrhizobium sp.]
MNLQVLALAFLAAVAIGGVCWVFLYPLLSGERKAEQRRSSVAKQEPVVRQAEKTQRSRREQVETSLKDLEARAQKQKKVALNVRITQAGLDWPVKKFWIISGVLGAAAMVGAFVAGGGPLGSIGLGFAAGFGLPRWILSFLKKR